MPGGLPTALLLVLCGALCMPRGNDDQTLLHTSAMSWMFQPESWIALVTLTALEIVLGIDNVVFLSILSGKLPADERPKARRLGLALAMFLRIGLLLAL